MYDSSELMLQSYKRPTVNVRKSLEVVVPNKKRTNKSDSTLLSGSRGGTKVKMEVKKTG